LTPSDAAGGFSLHQEDGHDGCGTRDLAWLSHVSHGDALEWFDLVVFPGGDDWSGGGPPPPKKFRLVPFDGDARVPDDAADGGPGAWPTLRLPRADWKLWAERLDRFDLWGRPSGVPNLSYHESVVIDAHVGSHSRTFCTVSDHSFADLHAHLDRMSRRAHGESAKFISRFVNNEFTEWSQAKEPGAWCRPNRREVRTNDACTSAMGDAVKVVFVTEANGNFVRSTYDDAGVLVRDDSYWKGKPDERTWPPCEPNGWTIHQCP
jgi:hypothetical protein